MSDWADELANEIADQTYVGSDGRTDAERVADALRTVQRETAEVIINEIVPEVRENWCGKLPDRQLADAIKARFGLDKEGQ